jgi:hypothetical protein
MLPAKEGEERLRQVNRQVTSCPQSTYIGRDETGSVYLSTQLEHTYTATLLVRVNVVKGGGRAPPTLTSQANFTLMMECTPESGRYHSVYSVVLPICLLASEVV